MPWCRPARRLAAALLLSAAAAVAAPAAPRVVAVGDVHGAIEGLDAILREAALIDAGGRWIGGDAVLVQTGDFMDRGPRVRGVMDRLRALQSQAAEAGGTVHVLLGNHEGMNLLRLFRDVNPETCAEFAGPDSEERRRAALERRRERAAERRARDASAEGSSEDASIAAFDEEAWLEAHPPGALEYAEALGPDGEYGRWLRTLPGSVRVRDSVFVHGGFSDELDFASPDDLNRALSAEIERFDDARRHLIREGVILPSDDFPEIEAALAEEIPAFAERLRTGRSLRTPWEQERHRTALLAMAEAGRGWALRDDGPLWLRGFAKWGAEEGARRVGVLLDRFGTRRFVVGHTVVSPVGIIRRRFGGGVFLIDTGMLEAVYGGRPSALEIAGGLVRALYLLGGSEVLWGEVPPTAVALDLLRSGEVVAQQELPRGVTRPLLVELASGGRRVRAIFRHGVDERRDVRLRDGRPVAFLRDHWRNEVAAYRLSRALGLERVPPTTERRLGSRDGSLQLWIEGARAVGGSGAGTGSAADAAERERALADMVVFDNLIQNLDRHEENAVEGPDGRIWWIDHTRSFARDDRLPSPERIASVSAGLWDRLRGITDDEIRAAVEGSLGRFEVRALLERRRRLVDHIESLIRERGEESVVRPAPGEEADAA